MNEADRIAREQVARRKAEEKAAHRRQAQESSEQQAELERSIRMLVPEVVALIERSRCPPIEPISVRRYRFPLLGDLFGESTSIRGGWSLGYYGRQRLHLLASGKLCREGFVRPVSDLQHCAATIRANLLKLREHALAGDASKPWKPGAVEIR